MAKILITSGPTRQYLDPVRFISNASSGEMGRCIARAALEAGHEVTIVSGPVSIEYPKQARVINILTTNEMLAACQHEFENCEGMIGVAAPCDYQPTTVADHKLKKTGEPLVLELIQTPDVVATMGQQKGPNRWVVGFALETEDAHFRAVSKLHKKCCDLVVLNGAEAINSNINSVELIEASGQVVAAFQGDKRGVGKSIFHEIQSRLIDQKVAN